MAVSMAPMGVVPWRMSKIAGAPPQTMGAPGLASWWMVMPLMHSAACCTTEPSRVTGAAAPARGMETIWAGTPARARSIRFWAPKSLQISGGEGQTSNTACGFSASASRPPAKIASMSIMICSGVGREGTGHDRFRRVQQHQVQPVEVADFLGDLVADHRRRLGIVLRQHFGHFDQAHQVGVCDGSVFQRFGVEDVHAGRTGVEVDRIAAVVDRRLPCAVVQDRTRWGPFPGPAGPPLPGCGPPRWLRPLRAGGSQQSRALRRLHFDPGFHHELEGFIQDAVDQVFVRAIRFQAA